MDTPRTVDVRPKWVTPQQTIALLHHNPQSPSSSQTEVSNQRRQIQVPDPGDRKGSSKSYDVRRRTTIPQGASSGKAPKTGKPSRNSSGIQERNIDRVLSESQRQNQKGTQGEHLKTKADPSRPNSSNGGADTRGSKNRDKEPQDAPEMKELVFVSSYMYFYYNNTSSYRWCKQSACLCMTRKWDMFCFTDIES